MARSEVEDLSGRVNVDGQIWAGAHGAARCHSDKNKFVRFLNFQTFPFYYIPVWHFFCAEPRENGATELKDVLGRRCDVPVRKSVRDSTHARTASDLEAEQSQKVATKCS